MDRKEYSPQTWLNVATGGILFKPDRRAVREELECHLEDKTLDIQRIFPDMPPEEASRRALEGMGDPAEVGRELARVHRPWLGWLWQFSGRFLALLAVACLLYSMFSYDHYSSRGHPLWHQWETMYGSIEGEQQEFGGYTFQIIGAAYLAYPEDSSYIDGPRITVRISSPRFWERVDYWAVVNHLSAVDPDGETHTIASGVVNSVPGQGNHFLIGAHQSRLGLTYRDITVTLSRKDWQPDDRITLNFDLPGGSFSLGANIDTKVVAGE